MLDSARTATSAAAYARPSNSSEPRNIVICCDGTNNEFGKDITSVIRLVRVLDRDPVKQVLFYDPGVGTLPEPGWITWFGKRFSQFMGLAFGAGLKANVEEAYTYLMQTWEPGDRVYIFGFSRGAYTARVLAGMLHQVGLLPKGSHNLVPYAMRLYTSLRGRDRCKKPGDGHNESAGNGDRRKDREQNSGEDPYWELCDKFREAFARPMGPNDLTRNFQTHFLGLWDSVSSVGWIWNPLSFPYTGKNPSVNVIRHAVALGERRAFYRQNLMKPSARANAHDLPQDFEELWFPGVHSDVGGGYPEREGGLWRMPFEWIVTEARKAKLQVDEARLEKVVGHPVPERPWADEPHESLQGKWRLLEYVPKKVWRPDLGKSVYSCGRSRSRILRGPKRARDGKPGLPGEKLHRSVLLRVRTLNEAPPNLSESFLAKVRSLPTVPDAMEYEP